VSWLGDREGSVLDVRDVIGILHGRVVDRNFESQGDRHSRPRSRYNRISPLDSCPWPIRVGETIGVARPGSFAPYRIVKIAIPT
jgi:hypothetical protein